MKKLVVLVIVVFNLAISSGAQSRVKWKLDIGAQMISSPVVDNDLAYFGALDSTLYAVDVISGKVKWKLKTNGEIRSTVAIQNNDLFLLGGNGVLTCADKKTGSVNWRIVYDETALFMSERRYDFADYYDSSPVIDHDRLFFGTGSGNFFAIDLLSHKISWTFKANDIIHSAAQTDERNVFFTSFDGYLYALNKTDGELVWKFKSVGQRYFPKGEMQGSPVIENGILFAGSRDFNFYAINATKGTSNWNKRFERGWGLSATVSDSVIYVGTSDDHLLIAMDEFTGAEIWKADLKFNIFGKCAISDSVIYVPTIWGKLYALDKKSGMIKWTFSTDGFQKDTLKYFNKDDGFRDDIGSILKKPLDWIRAEHEMGGMFSTPAIMPGLLIVTTTEGIVYCLVN